MNISSVAYRRVSVSAPTYSGNMAILNLTILGIPVNNNSLITCQASGNSSNTSMILTKSVIGQATSMFSTCICANL